MREVGDWTRVRPLTIEDGEWNPYTLEWDCPDPAPTATPTPRPQPPKPDPDREFNPSTFTWECPEPTATPTPRPTATNTPRPTATNTPRPTATNTPRPTATNTPRPRPTATPTPTPSARGWLTAPQTTIDVGGSTTVTAEWEPPGLSTWLGFATDSTAVLGRSSRCSGTRFVEPPSEATLTVYGCQAGSGTVELRAGSITGRLLDSITITVNRPLPTATPPAVSNLVATASTTSVRLTWDDLDGATKYRVEHRLSPSTGSWTPVDTTANVRNVANLTPETSYAFRIRAYGDGTTFRAEWGAEAATTASTVGTVTLAKPPAPGGLSASSSGENSVSVSWTALTGADKYEVQYRQGSSGNWSTYKNDITGTSPTVSGLQCDTGYQFSVRAYGDDVTYRADWGAWSSASREVRTSMCTTPTPTPTPTNPTGSISASPAKIAVGQTTTITASWDNVTSTPKIRFGPHLAQTCSGTPAPGTPHTEIVAVETLTLTGCGDTPTVTVQLWDVDSNESLAAVNVAVLPLPTITSFDRVGYRYLQGRIPAAHSELQPGGNPVAQHERIPLHDIRGRCPPPTPPTSRPVGPSSTDRPHGPTFVGCRIGEGVLIEVRVVGTTGDGLVAEGPAYHVSRSYPANRHRASTRPRHDVRRHRPGGFQ